LRKSGKIALLERGEIMSTLGSRLRDARERKGWTQTDVCKKLKMSNSTLSGYERNYRKPDPDMILTFAELYEVTTDYLHGKTNNPTSAKIIVQPSTAFHDFDNITDEEKEYLETQLEIFRKIKKNK
jgi:transcriptional regulator with XRE-family HTH domain